MALKPSRPSHPIVGLRNKSDTPQGAFAGISRGGDGDFGSDPGGRGLDFDLLRL